MLTRGKLVVYTGRMKNTALRKAIEDAGGPAAVAQALGEKSLQVVCNWRERGVVPVNKCVAFEGLTGLSRKKLRPDWASYWPDMAA